MLRPFPDVLVNQKSMVGDSGVNNFETFLSDSSVLLFAKCCLVGCIYYATYWDWLLSLSSVYLSLLPVFLWFHYTFIFIAE